MEDMENYGYTLFRTIPLLIINLLWATQHNKNILVD